MSVSNLVIQLISSKTFLPIVPILNLKFALKKIALFARLFLYPIFAPLKIVLNLKIVPHLLLKFVPLFFLKFVLIKLFVPFVLLYHPLNVLPQFLPLYPKLSVLPKFPFLLKFRFQWWFPTMKTTARPTRARQP